MVYRNIKTGAEIITSSVIIAPNYVLVQGLGELVAQSGAPIEELQAPEPENEEAVTKQTPKASEKKSKSAPKKRTKK